MLRLRPGGSWEVIELNVGTKGQYINELSLDSQENLWMATSQGLVRFDGKNFKLWEPSSWGFDTTGYYKGSEVMGVTVDKQDRIWIAAFGVYSLTPEPVSLSVITAMEPNLNGFEISMKSEHSLHISGPDHMPIQNILISTVGGDIIKEIPIDNSLQGPATYDVDIEVLPKGVFLVNVKTQTGNFPKPFVH